MYRNSAQSETGRKRAKERKRMSTEAKTSDGVEEAVHFNQKRMKYANSGEKKRMKTL